MLACVGEQGYSATVVADVIGHAVASRKTFYEHFEDRQACFLALADELAAEWTQRATLAVELGADGASAADADGKADRARAKKDDAPTTATAALIDELFALGCERPAALRLLAAELTAAGETGLARRERLLAQLSKPLIADLGVGDASGKLLARSIVATTLRMLHARARRGAGVKRPRRRQAQELADALKAWAQRYRGGGSLPAIRSARDAPSPPVGGRAPGTLSLSAGSLERRGLPRGEGNVSRSFVVHNQRERILDALANLSAAGGYGPTTIPDIVREAAVSVQAFYEHFSGKEDAFLVAYELGHRKGLAIVERAYQTRERWSEAVCAAVQTLFDFLASEPAYAHLVLVDAPTASPRAASIAGEGLKAYAALLAPGTQAAEPEQAWVQIAAEATASLLLELCFVYAIDGQARDLPRLADLACALATRPFTA